MQWRLEVERVGPRLRTNLAADQRDWRQHLEAAHASTQALAGSWPEVKAVLTKLGAEVRCKCDAYSYSHNTPCSADWQQRCVVHVHSAVLMPLKQVMRACHSSILSMLVRNQQQPSR
jgi:hypothetical protein